MNCSRCNNPIPINEFTAYGTRCENCFALEFSKLTLNDGLGHGIHRLPHAITDSKLMEADRRRKDRHRPTSS